MYSTIQFANILHLRTIASILTHFSTKCFLAGKKNLVSSCLFYCFFMCLQYSLFAVFYRNAVSLRLNRRFEKFFRRFILPKRRLRFAFVANKSAKWNIEAEECRVKGRFSAFFRTFALRKTKW